MAILENIVSQYSMTRQLKSRINVSILYTYVMGNTNMDVSDTYRRTLKSVEALYISYKEDNMLYDCNDYDGVYDVLYIMKEVVNWGFEEMQDIEWLQIGDLRLLYIDGFMNALNQEIFETEEANLEVEDDKKEE